MSSGFTPLGRPFGAGNAQREAQEKRMVTPSDPAPETEFRPGNTVVLHNRGAFNCMFTVKWSDGESPKTSTAMVLQTKYIYMDDLKIPNGTSCWVKAYIQNGTDHESERNFTTSDARVPDVSYTITGTTHSSSFD